MNRDAWQSRAAAMADVLPGFKSRIDMFERATDRQILEGLQANDFMWKAWQRKFPGDLYPDTGELSKLQG